MSRHHDDEMVRQQQFEGAVEAIALRAGCLTSCQVCGQTYSTGEDIVAAYKLGNRLITNNDPLTEVFGGDRKAMTDALESLRSEYMDFCTYCTKKAEQD